ncbi:zinc ribbon domain-containing protein [Litchfieldia alkalitelluris]|uniref:zinc ribbon domain-containing protein n=1 Tax=Litchfieldia alkalitelluris TaxID=304268 RepID=UPI000996C960|nr:hypothetical protein [Litchfieldia alkalitelluris]
MKFCTSCGAKKVDDTPFCNECGHKFEEQPVKKTRENKNQIPSWSAFSLKKKLIIGGVLAILIIGFALYKVGDSLTDKTKLMASFTEHLENGDVKELTAMLDSGDESLTMTEDHVKDLIAFIKEDPYLEEEILAQLRENAKAGGFSLNSSMEASGEYDYLGQQLITFEKRGKKFFIYDNYDFVVQPLSISGYTNYDDLTFFVDGEEVKSPVIEDGYVTLGSFLPGNYKVKAVLSTDFVELEKEVDVSLYYTSEYDLTLDIDYVDVYSNVADATVLVNGKDTGLKLNSDKEVEVGPVLLDGSMNIQIEKDTPIGKLKSAEVSIDNDDLTVNLALSDEQKEVVTSQIKDTLLALSEAFNQKDASPLKNQSEYVQSEFEELLHYSFAGYLSDLKVNNNTFYIEERDGKWVTTVEVFEHWISSYYDEYEGAIATEDQATSFLYEMTYDEGKKNWSIDSIESMYGSDDGEMTQVDIDADGLKKKFEESPAYKELTTAMNTEGIDSFMTTYISTSVAAINNRDFSMVSGYIDPSSSAYLKEVEDYIDYLDSKGITEDLLLVEVAMVDQKDDETLTVTTNEEYYIHYEDGSTKFKAYESTYEVKTGSDGFKMYKLVETNEVDSEDL